MGSVETLDELDAVEMPGTASADHDAPETRQSSELAIPEAARAEHSTPVSVPASVAPSRRSEGPSVEASPAEFEHLDEEATSIFSASSAAAMAAVSAVPSAPPRTSPSLAHEGAESTVEYTSASFDDLGGLVDDADVDSVVTAVESLEERARNAQGSQSAERPAAAHLGGHRLTDAWVARAEWFEDEAEASEDLPARARLLLAASELWAMAGNTARARDTAKRAAQAAPSLSLAARQARAVAALEGDWKAVAVALDAESRAATTDAMRAHAAYVAAEVYRLALADAASAERRLDLVVRAAPNDPRPHALRLSMALGSSAAGPKLKWPESKDLEPLARAAAELGRLRGEPRATPVPGESAPSITAIAFEEARRALDAGDRALAGSALGGLARVPGIGDAALFLAAALLAPTAETRTAAIVALTELGKSDSNPSVRRALAARSLEQGDSDAMARALASEGEGESSAASPAFAPADRVALGALAGSDTEALARTVREISDDDLLRPLAAAVTAAASAQGSIPIGDPATRAFLALGRALATAPGTDSLKDPVHAVRAAAPNAALGRILSLELDAAAGATSAVAAELTRLAPADQQGFGKLAAALLEEAAGHADVARRHYAAALGTPAAAEAAVRALLRPDEARASDLLSTLASALGEETTARQALILFEAAMRGDQEDTAAMEELLGRAHDACPELPFAARRGADLARARGDAPKLLEWIQKERAAAREPLARALAGVREALLIADDDAPSAAVRVLEALDVRPDDAALHELAERLDPTPFVARGQFRERLAERTESPRTKAWLLFEAMTEYARAGAGDDAARVAGVLASTDGSALARIAAQRVLPEQAPPPPEGLFASRALEHELLGSDRDDELQALSATLIDLPDTGEAGAHARLAARLLTKKATWDETRELVERAAKRTPRSLWTLRQASALSRVAGDDPRLLESEMELLSRVHRPLDAATLALRAAEAAARMGREAEAIALLGRTLETSPDHLVALDLRARLAAESDAARAAEDLERLARTAKVPAHQWSAWYRAGILWIDVVSDVARGRSALEQAAALDVAREDVFDRLQLLYVQKGDRAKLASLLEHRLEKTDDPGERIALEVTRGKALSDIGDRGAARRALSAALEASPDHADALEAFANVSAADGDFQSAEQSWLRLARLTTEPGKQAEIYDHLAKAYENELQNPLRAEICYREILKRRPGDPAATESLVRVYVRLGDPVKALELSNGLVERAQTADEKRDRTLALALVYDEAAKDKKSAFAVLEKARKAWPHDPAVLRGVVDHHVRHGEAAAANVLLDRAGAEARRALAHGRFDLAFFGILEAAVTLRGNADAGVVVRATMAALEGKPDVPVQGAGAAASSVDLDDLLAPDLLSPALRALLRKLPGVLDAAYPVDVKALRAAPLPQESAELAQEMRVVAESIGVRGLEVLVSGALGPVFLPASSSPAKVVMGQALLGSEDDAGRYFSLFRALKMMQGQAAAFTRIPPIELLPATSALLALLAPGFQPQGVDAGKLADAKRRIQAALPSKLDDDVPTLALEVASSIGNRASQLGQAVGQWASRAALLAVGSPAIALRGVALSLGQPEGPPADVTERLKWAQRVPEARDIAVFSVSEGYAEARKRLGLG